MCMMCDGDVILLHSFIFVNKSGWDGSVWVISWDRDYLLLVWGSGGFDYILILIEVY